MGYPVLNQITLENVNDGEKSKNTHCEDPMTLVRDLFIRQDKLVNKCNDYLHNQSMKLKNESLMLELDNGSMNQCLVDASENLCFDIYIA